jgi:isoleucyl-tRNA synthetase
MVVTGVTRAEGSKCQRCWNYSTLVGSDAEHPTLCERCSPVIRDMAFKLPSPTALVA